MTLSLRAPNTVSNINVVLLGTNIPKGGAREEDNPVGDTHRMRLGTVGDPGNATPVFMGWEGSPAGMADRLLPCDCY